ncbi:MAG: hypothetical protein ACI8VE_000186 [Natrialbaceae archaeon]|jgi:hypothetical protein
MVILAFWIVIPLAIGYCRFARTALNYRDRRPGHGVRTRKWETGWGGKRG